MDCDIHSDGVGGHGTWQGALFGHGRWRVQVEVRWGRVAAAPRPLRDVIFGAYYRKTPNGGGGSQGLSHGLYLDVVSTVTCRVCW